LVIGGVEAPVKRWCVLPVLLSATLSSVYHWPFDFSFSNVYCCTIITLAAVFQWKKPGSLILAMIFHSSLDVFGILAS
jgi:hypothetical protein